MTQPIGDPEINAAGLPRGNYRYSDRELANTIREQIDLANGEWTDRISEQRRAALKSYNGDDPKRPENTNTSSYIDRTTFDTVETMKTKMLRVFMSNRNVCKFEPRDENDIVQTELANAYVNYCWREMNNGYLLLSDFMHDAMLAKIGVFKREVTTDTKKEYELFEGPVADLDAILARPEYEIAEAPEYWSEERAEIVPGVGMVVSQVEMARVEIVKTTEKPIVKIKVPAPENIFIDGDIQERSNVRFIAERFEATRAELVDAGFDRTLVDRITYDKRNVSVDIVEYARHSYDQTWGYKNRREQEERTVVELFEAYIYIDMDDDGISELWRCIMAGGGDEILFKERVSEMPYYWWSPYMVSHKVIGFCPGDIVPDLQRGKTMTIRGLIDHIYRVNTTRTIGRLDAIENPRDLLDNPIGGHIDADVGTVEPLQPGTLSPNTFALIETFDQAAETRTGANRLSRGLNGEAVSNQNADAMIERLMNAGDERLMEMARSFAEIVLKPLLQDVYRDGVEEGVWAYGVVSGQFMALDPSMMEPRDDLKIATALTPEEGIEEAQALLTMHQIKVQDPELVMQYTAKEKTALFYRAYELMGVANPKAYLASPDDPEVQRRAMMMQQNEQRMAKMEQEMATMMTLLQQRPAMEAINLESQVKADEKALDERKQDQAEYEFEKEYALEKEQKRNVAI